LFSDSCVFNGGSIFFASFSYQWNTAKMLHSSGVLCVSFTTDRSAGAEMTVNTVAINILLRWSKEGFCFMCCVRIVNRCV